MAPRIALICAAILALTGSAQAQSTPTVAGDMKAREIKVRKGDSLSMIAAREYWRALYELNKDRVKNPNLIYPGQMIRVTPGEESAVPVFSVLPPEEGDDDPVEVLFAARNDVSFTSKSGTVTAVKAGTRIAWVGTLNVKVGPARFRFANGTEIAVFENSVIALKGVRKDAAANTESRAIKVERGRVRVKQMVGSTAERRFVVQTSSTVVESRDGKMFEVQARDDGTRVSAYEGATSAFIGTSETALAQGKGLWVRNDKAVSVYDLPLSAVGAGPEGVSGANVNFVWQPVANAVKYSLRVARDADMQRTVFAGEIPETNFKLEIKNDGVYYWTVESISAAGLSSMAGKVQKITVTSGSVAAEAAAAPAAPAASPAPASQPAQ